MIKLAIYNPDSASDKAIWKVEVDKSILAEADLAAGVRFTPGTAALTLTKGSALTQGDSVTAFLTVTNTGNGCWTIDKNVKIVDADITPIAGNEAQDFDVKFGYDPNEGSGTWWVKVTLTTDHTITNNGAAFGNLTLKFEAKDDARPSGWSIVIPVKLA